MTARWRVILFLLGACGMAALWLPAFIELPGPVQLRDRYLLSMVQRTYPERNITDIVSAVNFDYRGFDTIGEEFILFCSVVGATVLLRQAEEKHLQLRDAVTALRDVAPTDAMRLWILAMVAPKIAFGLYIVTHGQLSPGGGFQGGVILASAALIIYLGTDFHTFKRIMSHTMVDVTEAVGAAGFVIIGMIAWFWGKPFLTNTLPMGMTSQLTSGGTIPLISAAVGIEVTAGFVILLYALLQETLIVEGEE